MSKVYFENENTKRRYDVVSFDKDNGTVTLTGTHGVPFTEKFSKERFTEMGYTLKVEQAVPPPPAA